MECSIYFEVFHIDHKKDIQTVPGQNAFSQKLILVKKIIASLHRYLAARHSF